jgi:hypothetical protein
VADIATKRPRIKIIGNSNDAEIHGLLKTSPPTGICFGHQVVARALGGECVSNSSWEVAITEVDLTDLGQRVFGVQSLVRLPFCLLYFIPNAVAEHPTNAPRPCTHGSPIVSFAWVDGHDRKPGYGAVL